MIIECAWCGCGLGRTDDDDPGSAAQVTHSICRPCAAGVDAEDIRVTAAVKRRITLEALTRKMERAYHPYSSAWRDYVADATKLCGCAPWDSDSETSNVPRDFGWYWLSVAERKCCSYDAAGGLA